MSSWTAPYCPPHVPPRLFARFSMKKSARVVANELGERARVKGHFSYIASRNSPLIRPVGHLLPRFRGRRDRRNAGDLDQSSARPADPSAIDRFRRSVLIPLLFSFSVTAVSQAHADEKPAAGSIEAHGAFVRVKESATLPALERGQLKQVVGEPGDSVQAAQMLAVLDDAEATLNLELAQLDLAIAEKQHKDSVAVAIAKATLDEGKLLLLDQARLESQVFKAVAETDIAVRQATKDSEVSQAELDRAIVARQEFSSSVSEQQLSKLTLIRDQDLLKIEKSRHDQSVDLLRSRGRESLVTQQQVAVQRLEQSVKEAESFREIAKLKIQSLQKAAAIAEERVERRRLSAPFAGMVVEKFRNNGEWVESGDPVLRVLRLDALLVEGYVSAPLVSPKLRGHKVTVVCDVAGTPRKVEGTIVFVSPEIDSVSQQVQVRAEISNPDLALRPGQPAQMWITP